jgi:hypothetical protein
VADPRTKREAVRTGFSGVPPKKCTAGGGPNGWICAVVDPCSAVVTIGSTTPTSTRSESP